MYTLLPLFNWALQKISFIAVSLRNSNNEPPSSKGSDEYAEGVVCQVTDLKENEPKIFPLDEGKVLVIKQNGKINALGTKCTHYGAPLQSSAVGDGRLRCQWHGACFNILNGDIEDFPGKCKTFYFSVPMIRSNHSMFSSILSDS